MKEDAKIVVAKLDDDSETIESRRGSFGRSWAMYEVADVGLIQRWWQLTLPYSKLLFQGEQSRDDVQNSVRRAAANVAIV